MACFIVPVAEAVVTSIAAKAIKHGENSGAAASEGKITFSRKLGWLSKLLWGGSALLAFEHLWHGEISVYFPFLTAATTSEGTAVMLHEMATVGVTMSVAATVLWLGMLAVSAAVEKHAEHDKQNVTAESDGNRA